MFRQQLGEIYRKFIGDIQSSGRSFRPESTVNSNASGVPYIQKERRSWASQAGIGTKLLQHPEHCDEVA
jgi:hypothetical protein